MLSQEFVRSLLGTVAEIPCQGTHAFWRPHTACHEVAQVIVADPASRAVCHGHWREDNAEPWFHKADVGCLAARDASGVWRKVWQGWDFDREGYPVEAS